MSSAALSKKEIEDAFAEAVKADNQCGLGKIIAESPHGAVIAEKVADQLHYPATTISRVLKVLGFPSVSTETINKHRKGACRCITTN